MVLECTNNLLLYLMLGAIVGMVYSLKRIFRLEKAILSLESKLLTSVGSKQKKSRPKKKSKRKRR